MPDVTRVNIRMFPQLRPAMLARLSAPLQAALCFAIRAHPAWTQTVAAAGWERG